MGRGHRRQQRAGKWRVRLAESRAQHERRLGDKSVRSTISEALRRDAAARADFRPGYRLDKRLRVRQQRRVHLASGDGQRRRHRQLSCHRRNNARRFGCDERNCERNVADGVRQLRRASLRHCDRREQRRDRERRQHEQRRGAVQSSVDSGGWHGIKKFSELVERLRSGLSRLEHNESVHAVHAVRQHHHRRNRNGFLPEQPDERGALLQSAARSLTAHRTNVRYNFAV